MTSRLVRRAVLLLLLLGGSFFLLVFIPLPSILLLRWRDPSTTAFIRARQERLRAQGKKDTIDRRPVPLSQVAPVLIRAVLSAEDAHFFEHRGIDWDAVETARAWNRVHARDRRKRLRGASTLTQQLAKNLWLSGERTWLRKGREAAIAVVLDRFVPKRRTLEVYLSAIEFGEATYGCEAASRALFGVGANRLSTAQAARLAALIPGPRWYRAHPEAWEHRAALIERRLENYTLPEELAAPAR
ncbi:MAG: monofunctional biosynthetic peptidoglycan transglycosylase [Acidobacteriota bacterium]